MDQFMMNVINGRETLWQSYGRERLNEVLTRDAFLDQDDIWDTLYAADQDAWDWVYQNRYRYSNRIRDIIEPNDFMIPTKKLKFRVVELSDKDMHKMELEQQKKADEAFESDWIEYSKDVPDRSLGSIDTTLDNAWESFCRAKDALTKYLESSSKKYVAPSARVKNSVTPKQTELENHIRKMETEYDIAHKVVDDEDRHYWECRKDEYRKIWMSTL